MNTRPTPRLTSWQSFELSLLQKFQSCLQRRRQEHVRDRVHHGGDQATDWGHKFGQESHLCAFLLGLVFFLLHHSDDSPSASLGEAHLNSSRSRSSQSYQTSSPPLDQINLSHAAVLDKRRRPVVASLGGKKDMQVVVKPARMFSLRSKVTLGKKTLQIITDYPAQWVRGLF